MTNVKTSEFSNDIENQIVEILQNNIHNEARKRIMRLGFDLFEADYYASQSLKAQSLKANGEKFKLTRAQLNTKTFENIFPKF